MPFAIEELGHDHSRLSRSRADVSLLTRSDEPTSLASSGGGDSTVGAREPTSAFFRLPNVTPQLLAKFANVLAAVNTGLAGGNVVCCELVPARGDERGTWYDVVLLLCRLNKLFIPSDTDPSGDGVTGDPNGFPSLDGDDDKSVWSVRAVVGGAFVAPGEDPSVGRRPENLEVVDNREARDPGRNGDGWLAKFWGTVEMIGGREGDGGGGGEVCTGDCEICGWGDGVSLGEDDVSCGASCGVTASRWGVPCCGPSPSI